VSNFELQFDPADIEALAASFSYQDDGACRSAGAAAAKRGYYTWEEFLTVCAWKTERSRGRVESNTAQAVEGATRDAF
jgi:hypothetical protein